MSRKARKNMSGRRGFFLASGPAVDKKFFRRHNALDMAVSSGPGAGEACAAEGRGLVFMGGFVSRQRIII